MSNLTIPILLDIPDKLIPVIDGFDNYRYFLCEGGRGGGKSHSIARFILYLTDKYNIRVVCGRETQNSINESVYSLFVDLIREYKLNFEISATKIVSRSNGSVIVFRGFREQGRFNIQGLEGVNLLWIDEAQALTKQTIDVLIPTIRKDTAKIFFTMNRHVVDDPAFAMFSNRDDCLHIHINYNENKFCTKALIKEAEECLKKSKEDYEHIWLGKPLAQAEDCVFSLEELAATSINRYQLRNNYGLRLAGFDVARYGDDKCAVVVIQQMGALHWEVVHVQEWGQRDTVHSAGLFQQIYNDFKCEGGIIDEDGIGGPVLDNLNRDRKKPYIGFRNPAISYLLNKDYANNRTVNTYKLKDMVSKGHIAITDEALIKELCTLRYTFDHSQRKILISKEQMRRDKVKSPNLADALIMAVSLIDNIKRSQDTQYVPKQAYSYQDDNIFANAGIR